MEHGELHSTMGADNADNRGWNVSCHGKDEQTSSTSAFFSETGEYCQCCCYFNPWAAALCGINTTAMHGPVSPSQKWMKGERVHEPPSAPSSCLCPSYFAVLWTAWDIAGAGDQGGSRRRDHKGTKERGNAWAKGREGQESILAAKNLLVVVGSLCWGKSMFPVMRCSLLCLATVSHSLSKEKAIPSSWWMGEPGQSWRYPSQVCPL